MGKLWQSVAFRLALLCGVLVIVSITAFAAVFYLGTIQSIERRVNHKLTTIAILLERDFERGGVQGVEKGIEYYLNDGVDFDTEIFLLTDPQGRELIGNLSTSEALIAAPLNRFIDGDVIRYGRAADARVLVHKLPNGDLLIVGRDMSSIRELIEHLWSTLAVGMLVGLAIAVGGTVLFRHQLQQRIGSIRRTIEEVQAGRLDTRIPVSGSGDEFVRLGAEMNSMFDKIEQLMDGVRHVSNTIAHNLRTPLGRIRGHLDDALRHGREQERLAKAAEDSIAQIDELIATFNKLLQIAESESGTRRRAFETVDLRAVAATVVELYDAIAEAQGVTLRTEFDGDVRTTGDKDLLASALANLLDNALKYGGDRVTISIHQLPETVLVSVQDNGPGIPEAERSNVTRPFYRLDQSKAGTGLGLSIVAAIARLHRAALRLEDAAPGLRVCMNLPLASS